MVIVSPLRIGLDWDRLQMAELHGEKKRGVTNYLQVLG